MTAFTIGKPKRVLKVFIVLLAALLVLVLMLAIYVFLTTHFAYRSKAAAALRQDLANLRSQDATLTRAYDKILIQSAWDFINIHGLVPAGISVGLIDSGVDVSNQEFMGIDLGNTPFGARRDAEEGGHGTQVAGIIGANNLLGQDISLPPRSPQMNGVIAGMQDAIYILEIRKLQSLPLFDIVLATRNIHQSGGRIINMSFSAVKSTALTEEQRTVIAGQLNPVSFSVAREIIGLLISEYNDVLFITSGGNENVDVENEIPASIERNNTVAIAATDLEDKRATFSTLEASSFGPAIGVSAPGVNVYSSAPVGQGNFPTSTLDYDLFFSGTSAAAPFVTGVAAILKSLKPALTPAQIKQVLTTTADPLFTTSTSELSKTLGSACNPGSRSDFRGCRLNALRAVCHPLVLDCKPGPYLQNPHTLFYVNFDQPYQASPSTTLTVATGTALISHSLTFPELADDPTIPDPKDCRAFDNGSSIVGHPYFSTTTGKFGLALHSAGRGLPQDQGSLFCHNTLLNQLGLNNPFPNYTVGLWLRPTLPPPTFGFRFFTMAETQVGRALIEANMFNGFPPGANPGIVSFNTVSFSGGSSLVGNTNITQNQGWHHILMVFDASSQRLRLYIDGRLDQEAPFTQQAANAFIQAIAGAENGSFTYNGDMDDLFVEDHAWTQQEVDSFERGVQEILP